jgi:hypothetical protein
MTYVSVPPTGIFAVSGASPAATPSLTTPAESNKDIDQDIINDSQ